MKFKCKVCGYVHEGELTADFKCPVCKVGADKFEKETKGTILRSKGILQSEEGDNWLYFDYVPGQFEIREGKKDYIGKVCVIAAGYTEEELKDIFMA